MPTEVGRGNWAQATNGRGEVQGDISEFREPIRATAIRGFCSLCGAWRGSLGLEPTPELYVNHVVQVFREVKRVLRDDGTLWLNLGDSYTSGGRKERDPGQSKLHPAFEGDAFADGLRQATPRGLKPKDLIGIPWRCAFALQSDGWYLRSDIIWAKPAPMPESVEDRPTRSHEYIFLLAKNERYYYDHEAIKEPSVAGHGSGNDFKRSARLSFQDKNGARGGPAWEYKGKHAETDSQAPGRRVLGSVAKARAEGMDHDQPFGDTRNRRDVWTVNTAQSPEFHFATFPPALILPCVLAGSPVGGVVLDPFCGSGTTLLVAKENGRRFIGIELNPDYVAMAEKRLAQEVLDF